MSAAHIPRSDVYTALTIELRQAGYLWREEMGGKHGKLIVKVNGREEAVVVSGSPSDRRAMANAVGWLRRRMREWEAERARPASLTQPTEREGNRFLRLFFEGQEVRVRDRDGRPWFVLADVCRTLGLTNPTVVAKALDDDEKAKLDLGPGSDATIISESGLYALVLRTRAAMTPGSLEHRFRKWVTAEVLPGLRQGAQTPPDWDRLLGMTKMLSHKVTELEKANAEIMAYITTPGTELVPAHDLAGTVTASMVIDMAGVPADERVRGTSAIVTRNLKDFSLQHGFRAYQTPEHIDPSKRWRFLREAALEWLTGASRGTEIVRSHVAQQRARIARKGQMALQLVEGSRR